MRRMLFAAALCTAMATPLHGQPAAERAELGRLHQRNAEIELELHQILRRVPAEFELDAARRRIAALASRAEMAVEVVIEPAVERLAMPDGRPAPFEIQRMRVAGRAPFGDVSALFLHAFLPAWVEELQLTPQADETVRFAGRLAFPRWVGEEPPSRRAGPLLDNLKFALQRREAVLGFARLLTKAQSDTEALVSGLGAFMRAADKLSLGATAARLETSPSGPNTVAIEGRLVGSAARRALPDALRGAGLASDAIRIERGSPCDSFRVRAAAAPRTGGEPRGEVIAGNGVFDAGAAAWCSAEPEPPLGTIVVGTRRPGGKPILRLRDVDLASVFSVINAFTAEGFVVAQEVRGRVGLELFEDASFEQVFTALAASGAAAGPPPLRLVTAGRAPAAAPALGARGPPVKLQLHHARLADFFCLAGEILGREVRVPSGLDRRAGIFIENDPIDLVIERVAASAGMLVHDAGARIDVGPAPAAALARRTDGANPCAMGRMGSGTRLVGRIRGLRDLAAGDLVISGLSVVAGDWTAYAYLPGRRMAQLRPGDELADGRVLAVGETGVVLRVNGTDRVELTLP